MIAVALIGIGIQSCRRSPSFEKIASKIQQLNVQNKRKQTNKSERTYPRREWRRCCLLVVSAGHSLSPTTNNRKIVGRDVGSPSVGFKNTFVFSICCPRGAEPPLGTITALLCAGVRSRSLDSQRSLSSRTFKSSPEFAPAIQLGRFRPATRPAQPYDSGLEYWLAFDFPRQKLLSPAAYDPLLWWASRKSPRRPMRPDFPRPRSLSKRPLGWTMPLWTSDLRSDGVGAGRSLKAGRAVIKYPRSLEIHAAINLRLGRSVKSLFGGPVESP
ncbi:signal recognition particle subunit SEC65 [Bradyrhizobium elkanii]|nr:signal recognition particle subunit SEC65 [Bradyrhizobium elkanii]